MWKYIKKYLLFAVIAALFMAGEVAMDLMQPKIMSSIVDEGVLGINNGGASDIELILRLGIQMIAIALFGCLCGSMNNVFVNYSGQNVGNNMRKDCFCRIMGFSFPQLDKFGTGSLVTRVTNDITQVQNFLSQFVRGMIRTVLLTFGSMLFLFQLNNTFGIIVICAFPLIVGCMAICISKANPLFPKLQERLDSINAIMQEDISGIRVIKACVREVYEKVKFGKANDELIKTQLRVLIIFALMNPAVNAVMYIATALIMLAGSYEVTSGAATPGAVMAAITYTTQMLHGILMLVMIFQNISRGMASWKRVKEVLDSRSELVDGKFGGDTLKKGEIEFKDVSFAYTKDGQKVLQDISFTVHQGETVAIMGATGCGKTSLVNLIPRFYDVTEGTVLVDGVDVREYDQKALRKKIAVALQKSELFSASVKENILWGDNEADENAVKSAAHTAQAEEFISGLEQGFDTLVAERGMSLSGGQKQRLSIARAVLKSAEILIFDDSTSALDLKTEAKLYEALRRQCPNSTKIIIAQRIASVRQADRIIILENGRIAASGTHEQLTESCGIYRDICNTNPC